MPMPAILDATAADAAPPPRSPLLEDAVDAARSLLQAALETGSLADRAAGLLMQFEPAPNANGRSDASEPLVALALQSRDARWLSAAVGQCRMQDNAARCASVARAWIDIEPDNAAAWLALMNSQPSPTADTWRGLTASKRHQLHFGWLAMQVQSRMPPGIAPSVQMLLTIDALGREAAFTLPSMQPVVSLCRGATADGDNHRPPCEQLMETMRDRSDTTYGMSMATALARGLQRPDADIDGMRQRLRAQIDGSAPPFDPAQPFGCAAVAAWEQFIEMRGRLGELGRLRAMQEKTAGPPR